MKIRLASPLQTESIVDGPGMRAVIWTQGCSHNCKGCHNPQTHDFNGGENFDTNDICNELSSLKYHTGITFSGGDPMFQPAACNALASYAKKIGLNVWCYTGFLYEDILKMARTNDIYYEFLSNIDILVDGKFILEKRNLNVLFRGSENQRLIDVQKSLKEKKIIKFDEKKYLEKVEEKSHLFI